MKPIKNPTQEWWFDKWLDEAVTAGYIEQYNTPVVPFTLAEEVAIRWEEERTLYKGTSREFTRKEQRKKVIITGTSYIPDRVIVWKEPALGVLISDIFDKKQTTFFSAQYNKDLNVWLSYVDVKAPYRGGNRGEAFSVKKKWMWDKYKLYINQCVLYPAYSRSTMKTLWPNTWTPERYLMSDGLTKERTINNWDVKTVSEFMSEVAS